MIKKLISNYWIFLNLGVMLSLVYLIKSSTKLFIFYIAIISLIIGFVLYFLKRKSHNNINQ